jgi:sugar transferase (PEP-CTERM/EpsH1 system associated)
MTNGMAPHADTRPLIAHVVFRFDYGGLENGVANLINGLQEDSFRHAVVALTTVEGLRRRIARTDVAFHSLHKRPGKDPGAYLRLYRLLRSLRPAIVHTRNLGTIEGAVIARFAGVPYRIHGEHGWDVIDPEGKSPKYRALRRFMNPSIDRFVTVSHELERWLTSTVGIPAAKIQRICNGVDTDKFRPRAGVSRRPLPLAQFPADAIVVGTVTRFSAIKDPLNLVRAFVEARKAPAGERLRLAMIGDGELRHSAESMLREAGIAHAAWLPGSRDDVAELMREMDIFVLGSMREGISNTILEAMATGLPVIATATGGNAELVEHGVTGCLVPPGDALAIANALSDHVRDEELRTAHGRAGRERAVRDFSLRRMLAEYGALYGQRREARREVA